MSLLFMVEYLLISVLKVIIAQFRGNDIVAISALRKVLLSHSF